jgi:apolipoprotein N-acyltransferase
VLLFALFAALAGSLTAYLGFAPIGWWWFPYIGFAVLAGLIARSPTVKRGALIGFIFGLAYFLAGVSWVRVSMNEFGGMPLPLAWFSAFLFCAFLALYPMLAGAFTAWSKPKNPWFFAFVFASAWTFTEYLRAHLFTGFEWLSVGTSQVGPFAQTIITQSFGSFGASWLVLLLAGFLGFSSARAAELPKLAGWQHGAKLAAQVTFATFFVGWLGFTKFPFAEVVGKTVKVSLLQGNVAQSMKWEPEKFVQTLQLYEKLVTQAKGELIILPETALPAPLSRIPPEYIERLRGIANSKNANLIIGVPVQENGKFYNAAISLGVEDTQQYRKVHLVPFGEYMPLRGLLAWFYANLTIPMSDFSNGDALQPNIKVNGQSLGISICYEDAFARDVHRTLPDATLLVNISNDAWFGQSAAAEQHLQLSQMRAIEFARPMLRANNTGITAVIDEKGRVIQRLEPFKEGILETTVQGRKGSTPYAAWGDLPILLICLAGIGIGAAQRWRRG